MRKNISVMHLSEVIRSTEKFDCMTPLEWTAATSVGCMKKKCSWLIGWLVGRLGTIAAPLRYFDAKMITLLKMSRVCGHRYSDNARQQRSFRIVPDDLCVTSSFLTFLLIRCAVTNLCLKFSFHSAPWILSYQIWNQKEREIEGNWRRQSENETL